ncbi:hypothetical protein B0T19DRAFT_439337 [Cercophora scortea]|uniref:Uncharacterized protein n=1 Tax=Cercophora scortea TaxID=314031 RepID=A0AAE0IWM2_9PEZI|nr:hypothetical protein B0T19DRAFT_439337 [Cercophora scortea]
MLNPGPETLSAKGTGRIRAPPPATRTTTEGLWWDGPATLRWLEQVNPTCIPALESNPPETLRRIMITPPLVTLRVMARIQPNNWLRKSTSRSSQRAHEDFVRSQFERGPKDLGRYPTPRPNKHYTQSVPSLPSMTTINFSDDGAVSRVAVGSSDIRNSIAPKHSIQDYGDSWVRHNWDNPNGRDNDEIFHSSDYLSQVIPDWMKRIPDEAVATFLDEGTPMHWKCDVNTETGSLLPAIQYPETQMDLTATEPQLIWRQQNWTATLVINREVHKMQQRNRQQGAAGPSTTPAHDPVAASDEEDDQTPWARKNTKPQVKETPTSPFSPSIACYLRPAEKGDMGQVATIYNSEVSNGLQTLDSAPLSVEDFEKILATAQQLGMPFLVAVAGSARQMTLPYGCATLSVYAQPAPSNAEQGGVDYSAYPQYSSDNTNPPELHKSVLGFAYLSVWEPGLAGSGNGSSRGTARVNLFVHAEHRRKKIGFSLLDKLLTAVSSRFMSETAYDFVDLTKNPTYKNPKDHARKYFRLYLNYFVKHKLPALHKPELAKEQESYDDDLVWVREMLKRFCFEEKVRFESVHRTPKGRSSVFWLDSVVFEHTCHMVQP